jgi:hypothetical protein
MNEQPSKPQAPAETTPEREKRSVREAVRGRDWQMVESVAGEEIGWEGGREGGRLWKRAREASEGASGRSRAAAPEVKTGAASWNVHPSALSSVASFVLARASTFVSVSVAGGIRVGIRELVKKLPRLRQENLTCRGQGILARKSSFSSIVSYHFHPKFRTIFIQVWRFPLMFYS